MPPRRTSTFILALGLCLLTVLVISNSQTGASQKQPESPREPASGSSKLTRFKDTLPSFEIPDFHFSFQKSAHRPPEQKNSTGGGISWYSDWKWLNPFSSSITLDEERALLPPLLDRPPIYTYYETKSARTEESLENDKRTLQIWRRAWWAKGFRPIVLSEAEALSNPLYATWRRNDVSPTMEFEIFRWLAWGHMGTGLLSSWHCVPMGAYDDPLLTRLRRGQFEKLTRFEGLQAGLLTGGKTEINDAVKEVMTDLKLNTYKGMVDAINQARFDVEQPSAIAHYDSATIQAKYPNLAQKLADDANAGHRALNDLMISHLHGTWQNQFSSGIAVLKPLPMHTTSLIDPAHRLAKLLTECPESILQSSCPPNRPKCSPCVGKKMRITTPPSFRNTSTLYTISTVPHPYTLITLNNQSDAISLAHIRRKTERDQWITAVTRDVLGDGRGAPSRLIALKNAVASDAGKSRSLWFTIEETSALLNPPPPPPKAPSNEAHPQEESITPFPEEWLEGLEWHFGFPIPRIKISHGESFPPVPGPERWSNMIPGLPADLKKSSDPPPPTELERILEVNLLQKARVTLGPSRKGTLGSIVHIAEAWNLADTEVWKFIKAYHAREVVERSEWQRQEASFTIGASKGKLRWW